MFTFSRLHHSPDSEGYYILLPMSKPEDDARFGPPHFSTSGERGQWKREHHLVGILTLLHDRWHGNKRTWMSLAVKDGLTEEEKSYLQQDVFLFAKVPDCSNAGHREPMQGWFMEESFFPPEAKPQDSD
jgi:hypothetical protein